jgi:hypothetical protein
MKKNFLIVLFQLFCLFPVLAQSYSWTGGGANYNWDNPANWEAGLFPTLIHGEVLEGDLMINYNTNNNYPVLTNLSIGDGWTDYVIGKVTIAPGAKLTVTGNLFCEGIIDGVTYGTFIIQANAASYGMLKCDNVTGTNMSVELYLEGGGSHDHFFVPAVQSMQIGGSSPSINSVRSTLGNLTFGGDLLLYDETRAISTKEAGWQYFDGYGATTKFNTLSSDRGYDIYLPVSGSIRFKGTIISSQKIFSLSYTAGNAGAGWNLVGNPYPINYDLKGIPELNTDDDNVANTVYFYSNGVYEYYNPYLEIGSYGSNIVPAMQGFYVKTTSTGKTITLPVSSKTYATSHARSKGAEEKSESKSADIKKIKLKLTSNSLTDETFVILENGSTFDFNENIDAFKLFGSEDIPFIYSELNGVDYYIKSVSEPNIGDTEIPLKIQIKQSGTHTINVADFSNLENINVSLKHGSNVIPLNSSASYSFNLSPGTYNDFSLVLSNIVTSAKDTDAGSLKTWYSNSYLFLMIPEILQNRAEINIYDFNGKKVFSQNDVSIVGGQTNQVPVNLTKGFYLLDLKYDGRLHKAKFVVY